MIESSTPLRCAIYVSSLLGHFFLYEFLTRFYCTKMMGKTWISLCFPCPNQVRNMHNYLRFFSKSYAQRKNSIFILYKDSKSVNKNYTLDSGVPKSNPHGEDENWNPKSLVNPKSSTWWLKPWSWHTSDEKEKRVETLSLYLSGWWKTKVMETLTRRGYL